MNPKQLKFCVEYLKDMNATQAAIRAGYSKKTANRIASQLLSKLDIKNKIEQLRQKEFKKDIATAEEVAFFLSQVMRGEVKEVKTIATPDGEVRQIETEPSIKDKVRASELLGKRVQMFSERLDIMADIRPVIVEDIPQHD